MAVITLDDAKKHLRVTSSDADADIDAKLEQANEIVLGYLKSQADPGWSDGSVAVPGRVAAAVCLVLEDLHEHRRIDSTTMERLLVGLRDPALA